MRIVLVILSVVAIFLCIPTISMAAPSVGITVTARPDVPTVASSIVDIGMFGAFMVMALSATAVFYKMKRIVIGAFAAMSWFVWGVFTYNLVGDPQVVWISLGTFIIFIGMFISWEVWTDINVERQAMLEEDRAEDIDYLEDQLDNARDSMDDREISRLTKQIEKLKAKNNKTINFKRG